MHNGVGRRSASRAGHLALCLLSTCGCRQLAGIDSTGELDRCPDGQALDGKRCVPLPHCTENEVPTLRGDCLQAGVVDKDGHTTCAPDWFAPTDSHACNPRIAAGTCSEHQDLSYPGLGTACFDPLDFTCPLDSADAVVDDGELLDDSLHDTTLGPAPTILLKGTHTETITVYRTVNIIGCRATLTGASRGQPVITFGPGSSGSTLKGVDISGKDTSGATVAALGIKVTGATDVMLANLRVHDVNGPGIVFDDWPSKDCEPKPTSGSVRDSVVANVTGVGIAAYGATVTVAWSAIRSVAAQNDGEQGYGIAAFASGFFVKQTPKAPPTLGSPRTNLNVMQTLVEQCPNAGIFVEGSDANVESSVIRGISPPGDAATTSSWPIRGRGIAVESRLLGDMPGHAEVHRSVIEDVANAGITVRNSGRPSDDEQPDLKLEDSVIRRVGADRRGAARCASRGLQVRHDGAVNGKAMPSTVSRSVIEDVHGVALEGDGARVNVDHTIVRDVLRDACTKHLGDAIALYDSTHDNATASPGRISLDASRIIAPKRTAAAVFGGTLQLKDSALDTGPKAPRGVAISGEGGKLTGTGLCRSPTGWRRCESEAVTLEPSLFGDRCESVDRRICYEGCVAAFPFRNPDEYGLTIAGAAVSIFPDEEVRSVLTDSDGCYKLGGIPANSDIGITVAHPQYVPMRFLARTWDNEARESKGLGHGLISLDLAAGTTAIFGAPFDARSTVVNPQVDGPLGLKASLDPGPDGASSSRPFYWNPYILGPPVTAPFPNSCLTCAIGPYITFYNVSPGVHRVSLTLPKPEDEPCRPVTSPLLETAWSTDENTFEVRGLAGGIVSFHVTCGTPREVYDDDQPYWPQCRDAGACATPSACPSSPDGGP